MQNIFFCLPPFPLSTALIPEAVPSSHILLLSPAKVKTVLVELRTTMETEKTEQTTFSASLGDVGYAVDAFRVAHRLVIGVVDDGTAAIARA